MFGIARRSAGPLATTRLMVAMALLGVVVAFVANVVLPQALALFTSRPAVEGTVITARVFRGERVTPAFAVSDASSGSPVDASNATAFTADDLYFLARPWPVEFDDERYIELHFSSPLPGALAVANGELLVAVAADALAATICYHLELRRLASGEIVSSHGSPASPLACVTGTTFAQLAVPIGGLASTDLANDLRVRLFMRDSHGGAARIDAVSVSGSTPYADFTLYPVVTREAFDGQLETLRWGLAGP